MARLLYVALLLVSFVGITHHAEAKAATDDGKGVLVKDLLSQPFRVALLRAGGDANKQADGMYDITESATSVMGLQNIGFALEKASYELPNTNTNAMLVSDIYTHPYAPTSASTAAMSITKGFAKLRVEATFDKYDNYNLLKAQRVPREVMRSEGALRKTRLGQIRDTAMTVSVVGVAAGAVPASSAEAETTLLTLATLDPYLPSTQQLLGGRAGGLSQAVKYEATGHVELEGVMTAEKGFWGQLVKASKGATAAAAAVNGGADGGAVHGTFTLTFVNSQEFTLRLKPLSAGGAVVTFYGFATPPVAPEANTVATALATLLGVGSGSTITDTLFGLPTADSASATTIGGWTAMVANAIAVPMRSLLAAPTSDEGDDKARALVETVAFVSSWLFTSWPLLVAVMGVLFVKAVADRIATKREAQQLRQQSAAQQLRKEAVAGMTDAERRRLAKEAEEKVAKLLAQQQKQQPAAASKKMK